MKVNLIKVNGGLFPSLPDDEAQIAKIKRGQVVQYEIKKPRNSKFHRKFFAMLQIAVDNSNYNVECVLHALKLRIGHFTNMVLKDGSQVYVPRSISFAAMDNDEFEIFYNRCSQAIIDMFLADLDEKTLENEVNRMLGFI